MASQTPEESIPTCQGTEEVQQVSLIIINIAKATIEGLMVCVTARLWHRTPDPSLCM